MPTYEWVQRFRRDFEDLGPGQQRRFLAAVAEFVEDLDAGRPLRPGLRVKRVQGTDGVFEMTWAPDGRATFRFGEEVRPGEPHVVWRRVGTHDVLGAP